MAEKKWPCGCEKRRGETYHAHPYWDYPNAEPTCQVEHDHWEGRMVCGNPLPCRTHGGR